MSYLEFVVENVTRRLIAIGGRDGQQALEALRRLSPQELDVLARQEAGK